MKPIVFSPQIDLLIDSLRALPGIGPKSAQRIAFHLLERNRDGGLRLADALQQAMKNVGHCQTCRNFSETALCQLCANTHRDNSLLCVVETPADVFAIEQTSGYRGYYFVLQGRLSPLDGIGPNELGLDKLLYRVKNGVKEVILATNTTVEGEVTAHHIAKLLQPAGIHVSRIAQGIQIGGELEYADGATLARALAARLPIQ